MDDNFYFLLLMIFISPLQTHTKSQSHHDGGDTGAKAYRGEHEDTE